MLRNPQKAEKCQAEKWRLKPIGLHFSARHFSAVAFVFCELTLITSFQNKQIDNHTKRHNQRRNDYEVEIHD